MGELLLGFIKSIIHIVWTPSHTLFAKVIQQFRGRGTFTVSRADCGAPRRCRTPNFEEDVLHRVEETPSTVPEPLHMEWVCLIVLSERFCMRINYTLSIPRGYMQWVQPILHSVLIYVRICGSYIVVWKSLTLHDRHSSLTNVGSQGRLF